MGRTFNATQIQSKITNTDAGNSAQRNTAEKTHFSKLQSWVLISQPSKKTSQKISTCTLWNCKSVSDDDQGSDVGCFHLQAPKATALPKNKAYSVWVCFICYSCFLTLTAGGNFGHFASANFETGPLKKHKTSVFQLKLSYDFSEHLLDLDSKKLAFFQKNWPWSEYFWA